MIRGIGPLAALVKKELMILFFSPMAFVVLTAFLLVNGFIFDNLLLFLATPFAPGMLQAMTLFFGNLLFWVLMVAIPPLITMRGLAEEYQLGTFETLLTAPVNETTIVLGKYLACCLFFTALWFPTLCYPLLLGAHLPLDWGPILTGYLGTLLIGYLFLATGLLTSACTNNQVVAACLAFSINLFLFSLPLLDNHLKGGLAREILAHCGFFGHMLEFRRGIVDSRPLIFYLSFIALLLCWCRSILVARRGIS